MPSSQKQKAHALKDTIMHLCGTWMAILDGNQKKKNRPISDSHYLRHLLFIAPYTYLDLTPPQKLPFNLPGDLGFTYLSKAEQNNYNRPLPLLASPGVEVWHKLHAETGWHCSVRSNPEMTASPLLLQTLETYRRNKGFRASSVRSGL